MQIHLLSGFLGSGKTTAIRTAAGLMMREGLKTAVITNDQGIRLVDGGFLAAEGIPAREVVNGCFCCNYSDLDRQIGSLMTETSPEIIFAESVGSCTDIVATVLKPLRKFRPAAAVSLSVVCDSLLLKMFLIDRQSLFGADVEYIFWKQIEEAPLILLNKTDLIPPGDESRIRAEIRERFGAKTILSLRAWNAGDVSRWLNELRNAGSVTLTTPELDYDRYAAGEAMMGWLDQDIVIRTNNRTAVAAAKQVLTRVHEAVRNKSVPVGHIKWLIGANTKLSQTATGEMIFPDLPETDELHLLLNARAETDPETLTAIVAAATSATAAGTGSDIVISGHAAFQPGYPRPEHRFPG